MFYEKEIGTLFSELLITFVKRLKTFTSLKNAPRFTGYGFL